ncbi:MAG: phosphate ABC transporter permease PstA [Bdellovibrionaceae bacterium]|nr:phosphate ABC transporter permease PstA [Pseudobdellovibrionaceae bacterium]
MKPFNIKTQLSFSMMDRKRKLKSKIMVFFLMLAAVLAAIPFVFITSYVFYKGLSSINLDFFTQLPAAPGQLGGGIGNALLGSLIMVFMASVFAVPWGILGGAYLSEYSSTKLAKYLSFSVDLLTSVPSIVVGIFVYVILVTTMGKFSGLAGAMSLFIIMIPIVIRTTEEILKLVPFHIREAGLGLGLPRWKVILLIVIPGVKSSLISGVMLAIARAAGETAPLLFTSLANQYWSSNILEPMASVPVQVYNFAISGFEDLERQAWAGSLVLVFFVVTINLITRFLLNLNKLGRKK